MTLYDLLGKISHILTPEDDSFYKYAIYTSDDIGGCLRTRHCWWRDKPVRDRNLGEGYETVLVTSKKEISIEDFKNETDTLVKLQITFSNKNATESDADWDVELGYCHIYLFNLETGTYVKRYKPYPDR